jgi:type IV secretory pathway protease TraF
MVVAWPPRGVRALAAERHYLPLHVPLVKRVAAGPGTLVCATREHVRVGAYLTVLRRREDRQGRPLPWWEGCRRLRRGELFLLMEASSDSFDGRYFGVTKRSDVIGKAVLLWPH